MWSKKYIEVDAFVEKWPLVGKAMERKLGHVTLATDTSFIVWLSNGDKFKHVNM